MIEHVYTWKCDYPGCGEEQRAQVWVQDKERPLGLCPLEGWSTVEKGDGFRHYCRMCSNKIEGKGE